MAVKYRKTYVWVLMPANQSHDTLSFYVFLLAIIITIAYDQPKVHQHAKRVCCNFWLEGERSESFQPGLITDKLIKRR